MDDSEKKPTEWVFKESLPDYVIATKFEEIIKLMIEKKYDEALKLVKDNIEVLPNITVKYLSKSSYFPFSISKSTFVYIVFELFRMANCKDCIKFVIKNTKNHWIVATALVRMAKEHRKFVVELIKEMLMDELSRLEILSIIEILPLELAKEFEQELLNIAKKEVEETQYKALRTLADIRGEKEKYLFLSFIDDWDPEVRKISLRALLNYPKDPSIAKTAESVMRYEDIPTLKILIKKLIEKHGNP